MFLFVDFILNDKKYITSCTNEALNLILTIPVDGKRWFCLDLLVPFFAADPTWDECPEC